MDYDAESFIIEVTPLAFKTKLNLVCIDLNEDLTIKNGYFTGNDLDCDNEITLLYSLYHYDLLYLSSRAESLKEHQGEKTKEKYSELNSFKFEGKCEDNDMHYLMITFIDIGRTFCVECLKEKVEKSITELDTKLKKKKITEEDLENTTISLKNVELTQRHLFDLLGNTLRAYIKGEGKCFFCRKYEQDKIQLCPEKCFGCKECIKVELTKVTEGKIVLNQMEDQPILFKCAHKVLNADQFYSFFPNIKELIDDSAERMHKRLREVCCSCKLRLNSV